MSLHPEKKSDAGKKWRIDRSARPGLLAPPDRHLIVTEGTKTEPLYFDAMRRVIEEKAGGFYRGRIIIQGKGKSCLKLLDAALNQNNKEEQDFDHIWLVYDKDDFQLDDFDNTVYKCKALSQRGGTQYHALWSNQCFELWFLLHFHYYNADMPRDDYSVHITRHLAVMGQGEYDKVRGDMFIILLPRLNDAMQNAKLLMEQNAGNPPSKCIPGTTVYQLFDELEAYLR